MNAQVIPDTIRVNTFYLMRVDGRDEWYAEIDNPTNDYDGYCAAPTAIKMNDHYMSKAGFNSDRGLIYYNSRAYRNLTATII